MKKLFLVIAIFLSGTAVMAEECNHTPRSHHLEDKTNPDHNHNTALPESSKGEQ